MTLQDPLGIDLQCTNPDCTVAVTGKCLEGHTNYSIQCPYFSRDVSNLVELEESVQPDEAWGNSYETLGRKFWSGQELGTEAARKLMIAAPTHVIGLVGLSDVGKTTYLNSLFLKLSSSELPAKQFRFAGSQTLIGFEQRVRNTRNWDQANMPKELTERTLLVDHRQAGFMHLTLDTNSEVAKRYEVLLTDLPGEWFSSLIDDAANGERLSFLHRADGILFFVDATQLHDLKTRHKHIYTARNLLGRLVETVGISGKVPLTIVVSKIDLIGVDESSSELPGVADIVQDAEIWGFRPTVSYIASFSSIPEHIDNGYGVEESFSGILAPTKPVSLDYLAASSNLSRSFARFQMRRGED